MPKYAYMNNKLGNPIDANKVTIGNGKAKFICCTDNCNAEMILVGHGTGNAYFRSKNKKDHIGTECIKNSIIFSSDKYDESMFDLNFAFESMLGITHTTKTVTRGTTGTRKGVVGGNRRQRITTLASLYAMCLSKDKTDTYNGILIDDLLADDENYTRYKNGIEGYKIVETSKYYKIFNENAFIMNYPANNKGLDSWVKISFESSKLFFEHYQNLMDSNHVEPIIIAGNWKKVSGEKHHSECKIHKKTQIYYAKEQ